ncbi:hypothetical protein QA596_04930 [Balneolales bacterium ANBcel1]|nr:hypothetical protein [Balneolales bacterium ANBcel1]
MDHNDGVEEESPWDDPFQWEDPFEPGEYGWGSAPEGVESLFNIGQSNDGQHYYVVRHRPADEPFAPYHQLWIVDKNGENPRYITSQIYNADWSMDNRELAVGLSLGISSYIVTLNLEENSYKQWTGQPDHPIFNKQSEVFPKWFANDEKILFTVNTISYQQEYDLGGYFLDIETGEFEGPVTDWRSSNMFGNHEQIIWGQHADPENDIAMNMVRYDRTTGDWQWVTMYQLGAGNSTGGVLRTFSADPRSERIAVNKHWDNSMQLFLYDGDNDPVQITTGGSGAVSWNHDSTELIFLRDIYGYGRTQYVPFRHNLETGQTEPLWPDLPGYLPEFPDLSTQDPIPVSIER